MGSNYINKGQNTLYFEKFNVVNTSSLYFHQYMGNATAALTEGQSLAKGYSDKNQAFVFKNTCIQQYAIVSSGLR